jgi:hypothetical protein
MSEVSEKLRIMASNIDETRPPEYDYSLAQKRVDDADIDALISAADEIERLTAERDEARRHLCDLYVKGQPSSSNMTDQDYAAELGWDCFKEGTSQ